MIFTFAAGLVAFLCAIGWHAYGNRRAKQGFRANAREHLERGERAFIASGVLYAVSIVLFLITALQLYGIL